MKKKEPFIEEYISYRIYNHGSEYYLAAETLSGLEESHTAAIATCYSFAIELFLKSLKATKQMVHVVSASYDLIDETLLKPTREAGGGHNLLALFQCLDTSVQEEIIDLYFNTRPFREDNFIEDLRRNSTVFIDWRYQFEGKTYILEPDTLRKIAAVLNQYVKHKLSEQSEKYRSETHNPNTNLKS
ncbi:hypothetical protein [Vibrio renipiscarius]|uniref:HEPN domain-containing protein n=1 Tax=Vibrio renipiscarius TaxID=1461322 RepID=A0A0C2NCG3_9VIBR|nr:hypothetical protein [Vibrio renipiscarius]KII77316.1 hypothetical protein OJ16_12370 [Vibrio renipiscarius]KII77323.1 hypothetical protein PL18_15495 [Vibrio renipiscarius]